MLEQMNHVANAPAELQQRGLAASSTGSHQRGDERPPPPAHGKRTNGTDEKENEGETGKPAANKKRRTSSGAATAGKRRGRVGKLQSFQEIPMDLLVEIRPAHAPQHVPRQQAHAANLCVTYASLVYDRNCHLCGRGRSVMVDYCLRVRWCKACRSNNLIEGSKLRAAMPHMHPDLLDACLYTYASRSGHNAPLNPYYCLAEAERVDEKLRAFEAAGDRAGLTTYVEARLLIAASSVDDGEEISEWVADVAAEKATTREEVADQREREIAQRLVDLGYDEDDCFFPGMDDVVRKGGPLTERAWQNMRAFVVKCVEYNQLIRIRTGEFNRMKCARLDLEPYYTGLANAHKGPETFPTFRTFCQLPSVRTLWVPEDAVVTPELWTNLQPALASDLEKADRHLRVRLARHIVWDLRRAGLDYDESLDDNLTRSSQTFASMYANLFHSRTFHDLPRDVGVDRDYRFASSDADVDDLAPDVSDAQLDHLLTRFASLQRCCSWGCRAVLPFPAIHYHTLSGACRDVRTESLPRLLLKQLDSLRLAAGLPDHVSSLDSLRALGPVFCCHNCRTSPVDSSSDEEDDDEEEEEDPPVAPRIDLPHLAFDDLLAHALKCHADEQESQPHAEMRLETVKYNELGQPE
ncbi:hypothetical protein C6P46_006866 [Rhodotorula mucilaginosa]|uniref:Uncharacterized protein n=1 Tax=Rhodotorula mucilaginosa TaxID=5537 RepID=A0A9P7B9F0_RHOMI|nr:hypothetical protein C6P46_006866 [Rhodotorula mucilaginosa]